MILVTVGTQLPFDRLLSALDAWAATQAEELVAQVGPSDLVFRHLRAQPFMKPDEMEARFAQARLVVAHAGMGSILSALKHRKPIIIVPRKASLGEHRNEHQLATARWMVNRPGVTVAWEPEDAVALLQRGDWSNGGAGVEEYAQPQLLAALGKWVGRPD